MRLARALKGNIGMDLTNTVSKIVLEHPECAPVFQGLRIDFCCNGGVTLDEACAARGLDRRKVAAALERAIGNGAAQRTEDPRALSTAALVAHIVSRHHSYLRDSLPYLVPLVAKVVAVHGEREPRLAGLQAEFVELRESLDVHLDQEEETLFREVVADEPDAAVVRRELSGMREEHREIGAALGRIRALCDDYTPPAGACSSYRALLTGLRQLEDDIVRHVHLENEVLLPRFIPEAERTS